MVSYYSKDWVAQQLQYWQTTTTSEASDASSCGPPRILWADLDEEAVRASTDLLSLPFPAILTRDDGMTQALRALYQYGILLVTETPIDDGGAGIAALGAALGGGAVKNQLSIYQSYKQNGGGSSDSDHHHHLVLPHGTDGPLRTLYGTVWATSSSSQAEGSSRADSAYGTDGLPLHTDMTYHRDPPGLQIFTMAQPSQQGGESIFGDGFAAAERLRTRHPRAFQTLASTVRRYRCVDAETGWNLQATGPVIQTDCAGRVVAIRHNDLDRLPDLPPPPHAMNSSDSNTAESFYEQLEEAHDVWDGILGDDDIRLVMSLQAGETMVVANQVCVHINKSGVAVVVTIVIVIMSYIKHVHLFSTHSGVFTVDLDFASCLVRNRDPSWVVMSAKTNSTLVFAWRALWFLRKECDFTSPVGKPKKPSLRASICALKWNRPLPQM